MPPQGVDQAAAAIEGRPTTRNIQTDMIALTQDNMSTNEPYFYKSKC